MPDLIIATQNEGKVSELKSLLEGMPLRVRSIAELSSTISAPEESGLTFAENALLKARHYHALTGLLALADDSGLEVDALAGRPGIFSARYAGEGASGGEMVAKLLRELEGVPNAERRARFVCAIAIVGDNIEKIFDGTCEGTIAHEPRGHGGFGYDPVFMDSETGKTFAELTAFEKSRLSHRGQALVKVREFLKDFI